MSTIPSTGECTAHNKITKEECNCTDYVESDEIEGFCAECFHRRQHHLLSKPAASQKSTNVNKLLAGLLGGVSSDSGKGKVVASSSKFWGATGSFAAAVTASSSKRKAPVSLDAAHKEANKGMRPPAEGGSKKGKGRKQESRAESTFKVISVQVIPCGTRFVQNTLEVPESDEQNVLELPAGFDRVPNRVKTQAAVQKGLAVVNSSVGIEFDRNTSHEDVVESFAQLLPSVFSYLAGIQDGVQPAWCLATPLRNKLSVVPSSLPDGSVLDYNKGNGTTGFRNNRIFIVTIDPVPTDRLGEWKAEWEANNKSSFRKPVARTDADLEDEASLSEIERIADEDADANPSPEHIPTMNKRHLFSRSSGEEDDDDAEKPPKKKKALARKWKRTSEILDDEIANEIMNNDDFIDLTKENNTCASTPEFLRGPRSPIDPPSPGRPEVFHDATLGNPYDKNMTFDF
ncbi:hypothetical protein DFH07DRAFT_968222 [Mycena maculata]|uniref:Uncharacterized protein n=1 Tax=Mycena maculata TaxID=230809 RepID=A0AAD7I1E7_9AGAR|nr:hypothetical protein DFH07DRAFT_968222 [Mycena maculata]